MKETSVINAPKIIPSVSIIVPTDKSYPQYRIDERKMKSLLKTIENELLNKFSENKSKAVIDKLHTLIATIDHKQLSKALAIYVSSEKEKMFYLPFPVREKIIIDSSFEIRDLLYSTQNSVDYLIFVIVNHQAKVYHGFNNSLVEVKIKEMPLNIEMVKRDYPAKVGNFSDPYSIEDINLDRYLRVIDDALGRILKEINTPVIICGVEKTVAHFKRITKNTKNVVGYVEGSYKNSSKEDIYNAIEPVIIKWRENHQQSAMDKLAEAINRKEYAYGIENVWRAAMEKRGRLLVVEKDFMCPAKIGKDEFTLITEIFDKKESHVFPDIVDDVIELVLKNGGDMVFVDNGKLTEHKRIALITHY